MTPSSGLILGSLGSTALQVAWPFIFALDALAQGPQYPASCPPSSPAIATVVWEARQPLSGQVCAPGTYRVNSP